MKILNSTSLKTSLSQGAKEEIKKLNDQESRYEAISSELKTLEQDILKLNKEIDTKMNKLKA